MRMPRWRHQATTLSVSHGGVVEQFLEAALVSRVPGRVRVAVEAVDVAPEQEGVLDLFDAQGRPFDRSALGIDHLDHRRRLAVLLDLAPGHLQGFLLAPFEQLGHGPAIRTRRIGHTGRRADGDAVEDQIAVFAAAHRIVQKGHGQLARAGPQLHAEHVVGLLGPIDDERLPCRAADEQGHTRPLARGGRAAGTHGDLVGAGLLDCQIVAHPAVAPEVPLTRAGGPALGAQGRLFGLDDQLGPGA